MQRRHYHLRFIYHQTNKDITNNVRKEAALIDGCRIFHNNGSRYDTNGKTKYYHVILFNFLSFWNEYIIAH